MNTNGIIGLGHNNKFLNMISRLATFDERSDINRQQIFVYLLFLVFLYVFGVTDDNFDVSFCIASTVLKIFAIN